jgi:uncharacterized protein
MNLNRLLSFFVTSYLISWLIWLPLYLPAFGIRTLPVLPYHHAFGALGPLLAGIIFAVKENGERGFTGMINSMFNPKGKLVCLIIAILGPFLIVLIAIFANSFMSSSPVNFGGIGVSKEFPEFSFFSFFIYNLVSFGMGEETGWRGYALPALQKKFNPFWASLILAIGWALWHWPLFLYRPGYTEMGLSGIAGWFMSLVTGSILLTWMYNRSKSILVCAFFHATIDIVFTSDIASPDVMNIVGAIVTIWGLLTLLIFRRDFHPVLH